MTADTTLPRSAGFGIGQTPHFVGELCQPSCTATRSTTRLNSRISQWLCCPHEAAEELSIYLSRESLRVYPASSHEGGGVFSFVHPSRLDAWIFEAHLAEKREKFLLFQRASNASYPQLHVLANSRRNGSPHDHIRDGEPSARLENPKRFFEHFSFVCREIDDAIGNNHIYSAIWERDVFYLAPEKFNVLSSGLPLVLVRERQHLVSHVETVSLPGRTHALGAEQYIDSASGAEIKNSLSGIQLCQCRRVATAQRRQQRLRWNSGGLTVVIQIRRNGIPRFGCGATAPTRTAAAGGRVALNDAQRGRAVLLLHGRPQLILIGHVRHCVLPISIKVDGLVKKKHGSTATFTSSTRASTSPRPQVLENRFSIVEHLTIQLVIRPASLSTVCHNAGLLQNAEMKRKPGLSCVQRVLKLAHTPFARLEHRDNFKARLVGQRLKDLRGPRGVGDSLSRHALKISRIFDTSRAAQPLSFRRRLRAQPQWLFSASV